MYLIEKIPHIDWYEQKKNGAVENRHVACNLLFGIKLMYRQPQISSTVNKRLFEKISWT